MEEALEAMGFGKFQWKMSFLTGLSWVRLLKHTDKSCLLSQVSTLSDVVPPRLSSEHVGRRRHGDDDPQHLRSSAALWVEAAQLSGGSHNIGKVWFGLTLQLEACWVGKHLCSAAVACVCLRWCSSGWGSAHLCGGMCPTSMAEKLWVLSNIQVHHISFFFYMSQYFMFSIYVFVVNRVWPFACAGLCTTACWVPLLQCTAGSWSCGAS